MTNFFRLFLLLDALMVLFFAFGGDYPGLLNSQVGALSAMAVAVGSFLGYRQSVNDRVQKFDGIAGEERDGIDRIEDPHGLYDEEPVNEKELSSEEVKQIFAEEKAKVKELSGVKNLFLTYRGIFSPFRLIGYSLLLFGFFWLEGNGYLAILPYLAGLSLLPLTTLFSAVTAR